MQNKILENGGTFKEWLESIDSDITNQGSVKVSIICDDGDWIPTYNFPNGRSDAPIEACYQSFEDAILMTTGMHVVEAKNNRSIQLISDLDINNITEKTEATFLIEEEQH
jgi:hypothetical protein